jgi:UDP-glucose 4-epimerase
MKVLVTGAAGFIGRHLVRALAARGDNVRALDRKVPCKWPRLNGATCICGDVKQPGDLYSVLEQVDVIYHLAAVLNGGPVDTFDVNANGTLTLMDEAAKVGVRHVVFASSAAVYDDEHRVNPRSPYGISKFAGEQAGLAWSKDGLSVVSLRLFNVYGPESRHGVVADFISAIRTNKPITLCGSGEQTRDFVYIDDVVAAFIAAGADSECSYTIDIGTSVETPISVLANMLESQMDRITVPILSRDHPGAARSRAELVSLGGWQPTVSLPDGLRRTLHWWRSDG